MWTIPKDGLTKTLTEPDFFLIGVFPVMYVSCLQCQCVCAGHQEKPNVLTFHPQARDLLMSAGYDGKIFLWDLSIHRVAMEMETLSQPVGSCFMYCTFPIMFLFIVSFLLLPGVQMECALLHSLRITVYESTILGALPVPLERGRDLWEAEGQGSHG